MAVERGSAQRGETVTLRIRFEQSGTLADPSSVDKVEILDESLAVVDTPAVAGVVHDGVGLYHLDWPVPAAEPLELHYDRWTVTPVLGASQKTFTLSFFVHDFSGAAAGTPYLTPAELAAYLPDSTTLSSAEIVELGALAQEIVEAVCGQKFLPVTAARVFDGLGKAVQPVDLPIVRGSVTKIEVLWDDSGWTDATPTDADNVRYMKGRRMIGLGNVLSRSQAAGGVHLPYWLRSHGACGVFPAGLQNVRITASWGRWTEVPRQIKAAVGTLVRYSGDCDDAQGIPSNPYVDESVPGGRAYKLRTILVSGAMVDRLTGYPDVDAVLKRFTRLPRAVAVL